MPPRRTASLLTKPASWTEGIRDTIFGKSIDFGSTLSLCSLEPDPVLSNRSLTRSASAPRCFIPGETYVHRYSQMVQPDKGIRFYSARRRLERRLRSYLGGREGRHRHPSRGPKAKLRHRAGPARQDFRGQSQDRLISTGPLRLARFFDRRSHDQRGSPRIRGYGAGAPARFPNSGSAG